MNWDGAVAADELSHMYRMEAVNAGSNSCCSSSSYTVRGTQFGYWGLATWGHAAALAAPSTALITLK